ncbi:Lipase 3 domain-containing protein [Abeliophyllum distichum]|uniref:Lipase 3 domain-containing protein n=1 Tax=Abeliophyllum distichum TaxID=126358 RepID=A0ABD1VRS4_9LAMI
MGCWKSAQPILCRLVLQAATGWSLAAGKSLSPENPSVSSASERNSTWGFTFRQPLKSPGGKNRYEQAVAVDDAVWVDQKFDKNKEEKQPEGPGGQNGNWVFKILHVGSLWKEGEEGQNGGIVEELGVKLKEENKNGGLKVNKNDEEKRECCVGYEECDVCTIDDEEKIEFDFEIS